MFYQGRVGGSVGSYQAAVPSNVLQDGWGEPGDVSVVLMEQQWEDGRFLFENPEEVEPLLLLHVCGC